MSPRNIRWLVAAMIIVGLSTPAVTSAARPPSPDGALGDSYSSGNGLAPAIAKSGACARSLSAYPELVARQLKFSSLTFVACSGATIAQIQSQAAGAAAQIRRARLVTVTAGGNDLPFTGLSEACIGLVASVSATAIRYVPGVSGPTYCNAALSKAVSLLGGRFNAIAGSISATPATLATALTKPSLIERRLAALYLKVLNEASAPRNSTSGTQLIVVQYPTLIEQPSSGNCLLSAAPINLPVQTSINGLFPGFGSSATSELIQVNRLLERETATVVASLHRRGYARISLVAPTSSFAPLNCLNGSSPDLNGIVLSASSSGLASDSLHPTRAGHSLIAAAIVAKWRTTGQ